MFGREVRWVVVVWAGFGVEIEVENAVCVRDDMIGKSTQHEP